ncbi:MAG: flagellar biosynthesis protein FlhB [Gammaproteobacteria bacterium]|nr:MAG: flagellar biosynthesis protein FlhB [Pseudomonadota bacterium]PIE38093.1 MAG: flagellar biosynthesis protein FlhB [Gammaproteobacteria bacterium]
MAEGDSSQEKTEEPTARRLQKAREEGQVARSKELGTMAVLLSGAVGLLVFGGWIAGALMNVLKESFVLDRHDMYDQTQMGAHIVSSAESVIWGALPFFVLMFIAAIAGHTALGGFLFSAKSLQPKLSKLNPIEGLKRMVSPNSLVELGKAILKIALVVTIAIFLLMGQTENLLHLPQEPLRPAIVKAVNILAWAFLTLSCSMIIVAAIDIPWQIYSHKKKLKMTKQEVKDEFKDIEGKPEIKGKIRRLQIEAAQRRMMQDVPDADVIITNPDHYAVALKYNGEVMAAPVMVAKGADHVAMKIREIAEAHNIEILSAPPLARAIYYHTEIGREIPAGLYMAVAQALAYVFQLKRYRSGYQTERPRKPAFPVPDDLKHD